MSMFAVVDGAVLVSVGSVLADPLPDGYTAVELSDVDAAHARSGGMWNGTGFDPPPDPVPAVVVDPADVAAVRVDPEAIAAVAALRADAGTLVGPAGPILVALCDAICPQEEP